MSISYTFESKIMKYFYLLIIVILLSCSTQNAKRLNTVKSIISNPEILYKLYKDTSQVSSYFYFKFKKDKSLDYVVNKLQKIDKNDYSIVFNKSHGDNHYIIKVSSNKLYNNVTFIFKKSNIKWRLVNILTIDPTNVEHY